MPRLLILLILTLPARAEITPIPRVVAFTPGHTLVLPVRLSDPRDRLATPACRFEVGDPTAELHFFAIRPGQGVLTPLRAWLGLDRAWTTIPAADAGAGDGPGFWAIVLDVPPEARGSLWINDHIVLTRQLDPDDQRPLPPIALSPDLAAALELEAGDPFRAWHARLALPDHTPAPIADPRIAAWSANLTASWRFALADLNATDSDLAIRLAARLWRTARFDGPIAWPLWPQSPAALSDLLEILLDPTRPGDRRATLVDIWLEERSRVLSWVLEPFASEGATLALLNLNDDPEIAWLYEPTRGAANPRELPPGEMLRIALAPPDEPGPSDESGQSDETDHTANWEIRTTGRTTRLAVSRAVQLIPPGAVLGPLLPDWTLETLQQGAPALGPPLRAMLYRVPIPAGPGAGPGVLQRYEDRVRYIWRIHVEGREQGELRIWLGPQGAATHVLRCSSEGWTADERAGGARTPVPIARDGDRWAMQIDLPPQPDELHIGLERLDARGNRASWPAARLPWQSEPARMVFNANTWLGL